MSGCKKNFLCYTWQCVVAETIEISSTHTKDKQHLSICEKWFSDYVR